jgi:lipopolysaccharide biosynthesis protein
VREADVRPVVPSRDDEAPDAATAECAWFRPALLAPSFEDAEQSARGAERSAKAQGCALSVG